MTSVEVKLDGPADERVASPAMISHPESRDLMRFRKPKWGKTWGGSRTKFFLKLIGFSQVRCKPENLQVVVAKTSCPAASRNLKKRALWNPDKIMKCQVNSSANCIVMIPHCFPATDMEWSTRKAVFQFIMRAWCAGQTKCLENVQLPHFNSQAPKRLRAMPTSRQDGQGVRNQIPCTKVKAWICSAGPDPKCWLRLLPDLNPDLLIS